MPQEAIDSVFIKYFSEDCLGLRGELSLLLQGFSLSPALRQLNCIQLLSIELQLL